MQTGGRINIIVRSQIITTEIFQAIVIEIDRSLIIHQSAANQRCNKKMTIKNLNVISIILSNYTPFIIKF